MTFLHQSAREWAEDHSAAADVRFGRLETVAFQRHPEIYEWFAEDGARTAERARRPTLSLGRRLLFWLIGILSVAGAIAPIMGIAVMGGDRFDFYRIEAERSVPIASVFYGVTVLMQVAVAIFWLARRARWDGVLASVACVALVFSGFGLVSMPNTAATDGFEDWRMWYPPVVVAFALSLGLVAAMLVRFRVRDEPEKVVDPSTGTARWGSPLDAIAALPREEREAIRADRDEALEILHARGLVKRSVVERALQYSLGTLYTLDEAADEKLRKAGS